MGAPRQVGTGALGIDVAIVREAAKKVFFLIPATKPPSSSVATFFIGIFLELQKSSFFLVARPLKRNFFSGFPHIRW